MDKSTTSVNLAVALSLQGAKVGLLDADVYRPKVPQMLGLGQADVKVIDTPNGQKFLPLEAHGIRTLIFGSGGGQQLSTELHAPLLGQIPIIVQKTKLSRTNDTTVNRAIDDAVVSANFAEFPRNAGDPKEVKENSLKLYRSFMTIFR